MKYSFLITLLLLTLSCKSQEHTKFTYEDFDIQILDYKPQKNGVSENSFQDALKFLAETQNRIRKNGKADISDHWNILTVFSNLDESNDNIDIAFKKFVHEERSCDYIISFEDYLDRYKEYISSKLKKRLEICKNNAQPENSQSINVEDYVKENGLDKHLVQTINQINVDDQKNRDNPGLQNGLDINNQKKIDSLYIIHQTYIGKSLVGDKFKHVMWAVIQHSNLDYMEKYLPVVISAVKSGELNQGALKFLIDRIYSIKYNYQIFGSQGNIRMANDKIREEVILKYGIE